MPHSSVKPISEKVAQLQKVSVSKSQREMIENLRDLGLMQAPRFTLAYGPTAQVYQPR